MAQDNELILDNEVGDKIQPVPVPEKDIGIDTEYTLINDIVEAGQVGKVDLSTIESFTNVSRSRNEIYNLLDMMMEDSTMASVLETYAEDATEYNDQGQIVWVEANDPKISKYIEFLLNRINVDKYIYGWVHSLIKYGDVYLKMYRESDEAAATVDYEPKDTRELLKESVVIQAHKPSDHYTGYVEAVKNPANIFELVKLGKTQGYIKTNVKAQTSSFDKIYTSRAFTSYNINLGNVEVYGADDFIHGYLEDNSSREDEEINIFIEDKSNIDDMNDTHYSFNVRRGQSLFYTAFKAWRELSLIKNAILLNRVTKSAIVRAIQVEVADMPKEQVIPHMQNLKQLIEQKSAIKAATSISEYTNPGPIENNIYIPTYDGKGAITIQSIGGDVDMGQLTDLDSFENTLFGALRVPKQYFGLTDDAAGFNGGSSLALISSRYAKTIKRIQNAVIQMITDMINLMLIDTGFDSYVNMFTIKMQAPTTQEEIDRRDNMTSKISMVNDIMNMLDVIEDPVKKLEILKSLLANIITDTDVIELIQDEIDKLSAEVEESSEETGAEDLDLDFNSPEMEEAESEAFGELPSPEEAGANEPAASEEGGENEAFENEEASENILNEDELSTNLPTPADLGIDMTLNG